jgi:hypothetical protein
MKWLDAVQKRRFPNKLGTRNKQVLKIIGEMPKLIVWTMKDLRISDVSVFKIWIEEEWTYLQGLKKEPAEETLQINYYQMLVNLWASE